MKVGSRVLALGWSLFLLSAAACGPFGGGGSSLPIGLAVQPMSTSDSLLVLVPQRGLDRIRKEIDEYKLQQIAAEGNERTAQLLQTRADTAIRVKEAERKSMKASLDLAEHEKNDVAISEWRSKMKLAELEKKMLEEREKLRSIEIDIARAQREYAAKHVEALEEELDLQAKREQRATFAGRELSAEVLSSLARLDRDLESMEKRTLELQADAARKRQDVSRREVELAKKRLKVLEAQTSVMRGQ